MEIISQDYQGGIAASEGSSRCGLRGDPMSQESGRDVQRRNGVGCFECGKMIRMGDPIWILETHNLPFCSEKCFDTYYWNHNSPHGIEYKGVFDEKVLDYFEVKEEF